MIRKAIAQDIDRIVEIYEAVHDGEEAGLITTGWKRGVYPTRQTVLDALERSDLFVEIDHDDIVAAAIMNQIQVPEYDDCQWENSAPEHEVMVLHTLAVDPPMSGRGYAKNFVRYYEEYAKSHGCQYLRMDTQVINSAARKLYAGLGYHETGIVDCVFNGIPNVKLVCLEKRL